MFLSSATLVIVPVTLIPHWQQQVGPVVVVACIHVALQHRCLVALQQNCCSPGERSDGPRLACHHRGQHNCSNGNQVCHFWAGFPQVASVLAQACFVANTFCVCCFFLAVLVRLQIRHHLMPRRLRVLVLGSATAVAGGQDGLGPTGGRSSKALKASSTAAGGGGAAESVCPPAHELAWGYDVVITTFQRLSNDWSMRSDPRLAERLVLLKVGW